MLVEQCVKRAAGQPFVVTGVLVVHDGAPWLKECLDALALQTRPLDRLVIVDTGSTDDSPRILATHNRIRQVIGSVLAMTAPRETTFGEAVGCAVEQRSDESGLTQPPNGDQWLWLLHDDSAAAPQALAQLLAAARRSPSVGVVGPKLTMWDNPSLLLELGPEITRSGRRAGGIATGEPDQGQHDRRTDVLGVNTSGMLIRRAVLEKLGGFDPAFGQFRDDLDLCWRAQLAGHRVVVAPGARIREAAASANGQRSPDHSVAAARRRDRRHGRQVALARCSPYAVAALMLWIVAASLASAAVLLLVKQPRRAWEELGDVGALITPWRPMAARWRARGSRRVRRRDIRGLFAPPTAGFRDTVDSVQDALSFRSGRPADDPADSALPLETGPVSADDQPLEGPARGTGSRILRHPGFLSVMAAAVLSVVAWRSLLGALISTKGSGIAGAELLPATADASGIWHAWLDGWHGAGLGSALEAPPYLPVLAGAAWVVEHVPLIDSPTFSVGLTISWLLAGAIPMSAWTAYLGAAVVTRARWPRAWAALAWASMATLTTAAASGRLGAVVGHILLPLIVAGFVCAARGSANIPVVFGTAAALGVAGAFNPALALLGAFSALVLLVVGHGATRLRAAVLLLVPIALLGPWILRLLNDPLLLLTGPGLTLWQDAAPAPWQLALLHTGGPGSYPVLLSAPIVLAGVVSMVRGRADSPAMTVLATLGLTGLAIGLAAPHLIIGHVPPGLAGAGAPITVWPGTGLDCAGLALIAATVIGLDGVSFRLFRSGFRWRRMLMATVAAAAILGVVASVAMAGFLGIGQTLQARVSSTPAVVADQANGPLGNRLLVLTSDAGTIGYRLVGGESGPVARDLPGAPVDPDPLLAAAVRTVVSKGDATPANAAIDVLADQGVGFVALRGVSTEPLVLQLDATAGLTRLSDNKGLILWRVLPRANAVSPSRLRVEDAAGVPLQPVAVTGDHGRTDISLGSAELGPSTPGRRLVVAEPPRWADHARVTFAGRELAPVAGAGQPTYVLPPQAGPLGITLAPTHLWWRWGQLGLLLVVLFLAVPVGSKGTRRTV